MNFFSPIACVDIFPDKSILAIRSSNEVDIYSPNGELRKSFPLRSARRVIACRAIADSDFVTIDNCQTVQSYRGDCLCQEISHPESSYMSSAIPGIIWTDYRCQIELLWGEKIAYRLEAVENSMALESRPRRVCLTPCVVGLKSKETQSLIPSMSGYCVSLCVGGAHIFTLNTGSGVEVFIDMYSLDSLELAGSSVLPPRLVERSGEMVGLCPLSDSCLLIVTVRGLVVASPITLECKSFIACPAMSSSPPRSPKIHPGLNVIRKHSEVRIAPFLEDSLLGLSLSERDSALPPSDVHKTHERPDIDFSCVSGTLFIRYARQVYTLNTARFEFEVFASQVVGSLHPLGPEYAFIFDSHSSELVLLEKHKAKEIILAGRSPLDSVGIAAIDSLVTTLNLNEIEFHFNNSVQASLGMDCSTRNCDIMNVFSLEEDRFFVVSSEGFTRVFELVPSSAAASLVSLEHEIQEKPTAQQVLVEVAKPGIRTDVHSVDVFHATLNGNRRLVQVTEKHIYIDGEMSWSTNDAIISVDKNDDGFTSLTGNGVVVSWYPDTFEIDSWESKVIDSTVVCALGNDGTIMIGTFDGELHAFENQSVVASLSVVSKEAIDCIANAGQELIVSARNGEVFVVSGMRVVRSLGMPGGIKLTGGPGNTILVYGDKLAVIDPLNSFEVKSVELGQLGSITCLCGKYVAYLSESEKIVKFDIDTCSNTSSYTKSIPFKASSMVVAKDNESNVDLYMVGSLDKLGRSALFVLLLDKARVGLIGINDAVSVSSVLPFSEVNEEPVSIALWNHHMFPDGGLVAVGTKAQGRGRLILFDRESMHAIAKTSVPSSAVYALCELNKNVLILGCGDCVALVGLKPGPRTMPVVLYTISSFTTYEPVQHISRIDSNRFLIVTERGSVMLMTLNGDQIVQEAHLSSRIPIKSGCHVFPDRKHFACTSSSGELQVYKIDPELPIDAGTMVQTSSTYIGAQIRASCVQDGQLLILLSNGSILHPEVPRRLIGSTT
jgi:hypothetical protein